MHKCVAGTDVDPVPEAEDAAVHLEEGKARLVALFQHAHERVQFAAGDDGGEGQRVQVRVDLSV